jgi:hypothetical protein
MWQPKPLVVGHPKVTKRAYEQDPDTLCRAVEFATATVHNGLGPAGLRDLSDKQITKLTAQIERDYLASLLTSSTR